jgi:hypothetical protein
MSLGSPIQHLALAPGSRPSAIAKRKAPEPSRLALITVVLALGTLILYLALHGWTYYVLGLEERPFSPLHAELRSSGPIGIRLGLLGVFMFGILFLYPLRKRWRWLATIGTTRRWLDFHVVMGITAPIIISFHSSFKFHGLAGLAYWIMVSVALSGFIGRYVYAQIPRGLNSAKITLEELRAQAGQLAEALEGQKMLTPQDLALLLRLPSADEIRRMSLLSMFRSMSGEDIARFLRVARLRRRFLTRSEILLTAGGVFASKHSDLEAVISAARRHAWLVAKMAFLHRTERIFHLWHVVHRPFSLSFVALVLVHVSVILLLGYY